MPESDLEVTDMLSRATERVGLEWRKPPCPEPSRLDDWFLGVACAGSQRPAPGASLPDVYEGLTGRGRHLLPPETDLLTPPPSLPSVVQLGVTGVPPVERSVAMQVCPYTVSTQQGKPCLLFRACRYSSGLIWRGLYGLARLIHGRVPSWAWQSGMLRVQVTPAYRQTFTPWSDLSFLRAGVPLEQVSRHAVVYTDASAKGWGATFNGLAVSGFGRVPNCTGISTA